MASLLEIQRDCLTFEGYVYAIKSACILFIQH